MKSSAQRGREAELLREDYDGEIFAPVKGNDLLPRVRKDPPSITDGLDNVVHQAQPSWELEP